MQTFERDELKKLSEILVCGILQFIISVQSCYDDRIKQNKTVYTNTRCGINDSKMFVGNSKTMR